MQSFAGFAVVVSLPVVLSGQAPAQPGDTFKSLVPSAAPARSCESLLSVSLTNTTIDSAAVDETDRANPACRVTATVTHPPAGDKVRIFLAFPMKNWNGRFQGVGGGGFSGGSSAGVRGPATQGFATGSTDTGHEGGSGSFALDASGRLNWQLIRDNAYLGIHEMTVTGKALAQTFYGTAPARAYFNGCSTGGRQGLMEAQRYPDDYDGVMAAVRRDASGAVVRSRPLCQYPLVARYKGKGSSDEAASFECKAGF